MFARTPLRFAAALLFVLLAFPAAHAQVFRAYLASDGSDANPCTLAQPCRLLPAALAAVADGGEIWMLDSANYNTATVSIGKSVSILAVPGAVGSVVAVAGPALSISALAASVALRNLVVVPLPGAGGTHGVVLTGAGSTLFVENSLFNGLSGSGIRVTGNARLKVTDSVIRGGGSYAVFLEEGATADIMSTKLVANSGGGVFAVSTTATSTTATVSDSLIAQGAEGVYANTFVAGALARIFVTRCTIHNTAYALDADAPAGTAIVTVSNTMVVNNTNAWYVIGPGATVRSFGNNAMSDNSTAFGSLTPTTPL